MQANLVGPIHLVLDTHQVPKAAHMEVRPHPIREAHGTHPDLRLAVRTFLVADTLLDSQASYLVSLQVDSTLQGHLVVLLAFQQDCEWAVAEGSMAASCCEFAVVQLA